MHYNNIIEGLKINGPFSQSRSHNIVLMARSIVVQGGMQGSQLHIDDLRLSSLFIMNA